MEGKSSYKHVCRLRWTKEQIKAAGNGDKYFTFSLHPQALKALRPSYSNYIIMIDGLDGEAYLQLKDYIKGKSTIFTASIIGGDFDFLLNVFTDETTYSEIINNVNAILSKSNSRINERVERLHISYVVREEYIARGFQRMEKFSVSTDGIEKDFQKIEVALEDYMSPNATRIFGSQEKITRFLEYWEDRGAIDFFYIIEEKKIPLTVYLFCLYSNRDGFEKVVLQSREISKNITDFAKVSCKDGFERFYENINHMIRAEFESVEEYYKWKEMLYQHTINYGFHINVLSLINEQTLSEIPKKIGNYIEFENKIVEYNDFANENGRSIIIGNPLYGRIELSEPKLLLSLKSLQHHGVLIGSPGSGKTYTACTMVKKLHDEGISVHIIDGTNGIIPTFQDIYGSKVSVTEIDVDLDSSMDKIDNNGIFFYNGKLNSLKRLLRNILQSILSREQSGVGRETRNVILIEEAFRFLSDNDLAKDFFDAIVIAGRKGFSIWFSTQKLSDFPSSNGVGLYTLAKNRIFQKLEKSDYSVASKLICGPKYREEDAILDFEDWERATALVTFSTMKSLPPLRVKVNS